jgi:hypothetical protein
MLRWLEDRSDWLSPIVVKEVRQIVRGREFNYSFAGSLIMALTIAFFGAADALAGDGGSGRWVFVSLMGCLAFIGFAVVPLAAFSALRTERMEQTLELITLTALSPRRVVTGKLLAQAVKLTTLFAAIAPFIAMSFLLGGIDFVSILVSLAIVFMWAIWACALCLFLSTLMKSRAMSGLVFGAFGIVMLLVFGLTRTIFFVVSRSGMGAVFGLGVGSNDAWWAVAIGTTFCIFSLINLVLLAENRLSLPSENRVTTLRIGFLAQFLLLLAWILSFLGSTPSVRSNAVEVLGVVGGIHLAVVALFTVSEDLSMPRRAMLGMRASRAPRWVIAPFYPGGGRAVVYIIGQMLLLLAAGATVGATPYQMRWLLAVCGSICFFTGAPALGFRLVRPEGSTLHLRVGLLLLVPIVLTMPDVLHYLSSQSDVLDYRFGGRHLINPFRTLANWRLVESQHMFFVPLVMGLSGLVSYLGLMHVGRLTDETAGQEQQSLDRESGRADVLY